MSVRRSPVVAHRDTPEAIQPNTAHTETAPPPRKRRWSWGLAGLLAAANLWQSPFTTWAQEPEPQPSPEMTNEAYTLPTEDASGSASYPRLSFPQINYPLYPNEPPVVGGFGAKGRIGAQAGTTVGQSQPITNFDVSPYLFEGNLYLFGEGRIALGNDGKTGGSLGAGARYFFPQMNAILGAGGWVDIDATRGPTFHQWSIDTEFLSEFLDIRGNIYTPYGSLTQVTSQRFEPGSQNFIDRPLVDVLPGESQGTYLSFQRRIFSATALQGFDTLFTIPMPGEFAQELNLETSAGFYGYEAKDGSVSQTYGWRLRFDIDLFEKLSHMFLEVNNDKTFKTNVAFGADINYWHKLEHRPRLGHSQYNRLAEWVRRNRTVVALESSVLAAPELAINPTTGNPYVVYQVLQTDEVSHGGDGTIANPFQNLQDAINATGTGTATRPSDFIQFVQGNSVIQSGINIGPGLDGLQVIGEQSDPSIGIPVAGLNSDIFLPTVTPFPFNTPVIQNVVGTNAVTISSNNTTFAAIDITNTTGGDAIFAGAGVSGASIENVNIDTVNTGNGVNLVGTTGTFTFNNVNIEDIEGTAFQVLGGNPTVQFAGVSEIDNTTNSHAAHGYAVNIEDTSGGAVDLRSLVINDVGGRGVRVYGSAPGTSFSNVSFGVINLTDTLVTAPLPGEISNGAVYIRNHSGAVTFADTLTINGIDGVLGGDSFVVEGLQATGSVFAQGDVTISDRRGRGIYVVDSADAGGVGASPNAVRFQSGVTINNLGTGFVGNDSAVLFQSNSGGLIFGNGLTINGSRGDGVEVTSGLLAPAGTNTALFQVVNGTITNVTGAGGVTGTSFNVHDITKSAFGVVTSGLTINNRGTAGSGGLIGAGIRVFDFAGTAAFGLNTTVNNQSGSFANAIDVENNASTASIGFTTATVNDQLGAGSYGVRVFNNANNTAGVSFGTLNVESTDAIGVSMEDNQLVTIGGGTIDSTGARAIEVFTNAATTPIQQHTISLTSVSATGSDYGIFVDNSQGTFTVTGDGINALTGGTISGMTAAGAFFQDTQAASLSFMALNGNLRGVEANNLMPLSTVTSNGLLLNNMSITASGSEGIYAQDVSTFSLTNSNVSTNGVTNTQEQIELFATVGTIDSNGDGVLEVVTYNFNFDNNNIVDGTTAIAGTDMIYIHTAAAIANAVPLNLSFTNNGSPLSTTNFNSISANRGTGDAAVDTNWIGTTNVNIVNNQFNLSTAAGQIGLDFTINGLANVNYVNNGLNATGATATGIRTNFQQAATLTVSGNQVLDANNQPISGGGFVFSGASSTGLDLTFLASGNTVNINNNTLEFSGFGSTAILFERIVGSGGNTTVGIGGNTMSRVVNTNDNLTEHGVWFQVVQGTIALNGAAGNNVLFSNNQLLNEFQPFFYNFQMPAGASAGTQIQINNIFYP